MLPSIGDTAKSSPAKMEGASASSGGFLSRMLGRSPSKGAVAPAAQQAAGQIQGSGPSASSSSSSSSLLKAGLQPPQGSLKVAVQGSSGSNGWSIGSASKTSPIGRVPSAKTLEDAAGRAGSPRINTLMVASSSSSSSNSAGGLVVPRVPSAQRLTPLAPAAATAAPAASSRVSSATATGKLQPAQGEDEDVAKMTREELRQMTRALQKETAALKDHLEAISGSGKPGSGAGMQAASSSAAAPAAAAPARASGVTFGPTTTHRTSTLVVEFAEPRHQQRPSMIAQTVESIRAGGFNFASSEPRRSSAAPPCEFGSDLMEEDDAVSFVEEGGSSSTHVSKVAKTSSTQGKARGSTALETGPSLDPIQANRAAAEAAEVKRQLLMSQSVKQAATAEAEAKRAAEAKKQVAAAVPSPAAAPAAATASKLRRYKLLSVYPLLPPSLRREEWSLSQFAVEKRLHKGYASEVYKARDIQSGELMAVKVYSLPALGELNKVQLIREIRLHGSMAHRNVIELYVAFQEDTRVILVQKYADGGDLLKALHHAGGRLTEHSAVSMVIQPLLSCMVYLHGKGIIHRDIKPENILFDEGVLKVADFGLALNANEENAVTRAGTLHYMAPEVVKNPLKDHPDDFKNEVRYHYNVVVDSWAIGCLAFELLAGYPPFTANTQQQVVHNINNMDVQYTKRMSEDAVSFIKGALERLPHDRATSLELIKHPWIQQHMRRGSSRHLTLQPQVAVAKTTTDFTSGPALVKKQADTARRAADHGVHKESIMAPF